MLEKKSWETFRQTGLLLIINQILHIFGWAIVYNYNEDKTIRTVYPARCKFRGYTENTIADSYEKVTQYMKDNVDDLLKDFDD